MGKKIKIHLRGNGEGTLQCYTSGKLIANYKCLGKPGFPYKKDITVNTNSKQRYHKSIEFNGYIMEYCILIHGGKGAYIHAGYNNILDNEGPSAGCIHLEMNDARQVYNWIDSSIRILTTSS